MAPKRGARCADARGRSFEVDVEDERRRHEKVFRSATAEGDAEGGRAELKARSHMERRALPWATEARLPTVHIMEASRVSSNSRRSRGFR